MEFAPRIITPENTVEDSDAEISLRPQNLHEYIGQDKVKENLAIYIETMVSGLWTGNAPGTLEGQLLVTPHALTTFSWPGIGLPPWMIAGWKVRRIASYWLE